MKEKVKNVLRFVWELIGFLAFCLLMLLFLGILIEARF